MRCARLQLQERPRTKFETLPIEKPRRYCQKRMVDPMHNEDPRWAEVYKRFYCKSSLDHEVTRETPKLANASEDLFLSVQNLKFQGETSHTKRPRTSFKFKSLSDNKKHRMFVKQVVEDIDLEEDTSSQLTAYFFDDYVKYISNDRSRPSSGKSSIFIQGITKENKSIQVDTKHNTDVKKANFKGKKTSDDLVQKEGSDDKSKDKMEDAKISFHKSGKRKSLTISRVPSPETVQVIRVDVVCNYSTSSILSDYFDDKNKLNKIENNNTMEKYENMKVNNSHFANKYLLTNTVKTLDENVSGGAKVTLLCKTFKLSDRLKLSSDRKNTKAIKDGSKNKVRK